MIDVLIRKGPLPARHVLDQVDYAIELRDRILRFTTRFFDRVVHKRDLLGLAMPVVAQSRRSRPRLSAASSTIARVTRSFSICALP